MRTLIILTIFVCWGSVCVYTSKQMAEDNDLDDNHNNVDGAEDGNNRGANDEESEERNENEQENYEDDIDDTSSYDDSSEETTPYNFLNYPKQPKFIPKFPRFAILKRNVLRYSDDLL
ncbi:hypothetical protein KR215_011142 [Drosophila sulfurigaster]|nr:hypothetical protein KR215_011142 [Drosophila sulfurigaster]